MITIIFIAWKRKICLINRDTPTFTIHPSREHKEQWEKIAAKAHTPHEQTALQRQIEATDGQIDALVYELYELTDKEIRIVEGT